MRSGVPDRGAGLRLICGRRRAGATRHPPSGGPARTELPPWAGDDPRVGGGPVAQFPAPLSGTADHMVRPLRREPRSVADSWRAPVRPHYWQQARRSAVTPP
ncbi:hypothetical protein SCOCK_130137 [Actinacidiphila cocklensis]|uniref:Uncharacterized protein n=1 Tax=Actinacidiphila cocklensis TaxID=887465 RepID=A0A9W4DPP0_9ACTN|nr:hypothetical protein SCOCK_130137 [Actinacidiphila cocklensis]